mmetsp:Transcript_72998/g.152411  ORF Transcript_72998/g.152411 Transcript_72998/m.152411 type:complete len:227 (-) Transcript_72998:862-1542(-)
MRERSSLTVRAPFHTRHSSTCPSSAATDPLVPNINAPPLPIVASPAVWGPQYSSVVCTGWPSSHSGSPSSSTSYLTEGRAGSEGHGEALSVRRTAKCTKRPPLLCRSANATLTVAAPALCPTVTCVSLTCTDSVVAHSTLPAAHEPAGSLPAAKTNPPTASAGFTHPSTVNEKPGSPASARSSWNRQACPEGLSMHPPGDAVSAAADALSGTERYAPPESSSTLPT